MSSQKKLTKRKSITISDPGKILNLVMALNEETCVAMQLRINHYIREECEAELALMIIVNSERMEAYIEAIGTNALARKFKIRIVQKFNDVLKSNMETTELLHNLPSDFQDLVTPYILKDNVKKRFLIYPLVQDTQFSMIVCVLNPKVLEDQVSLFIGECILFCWPTISKTISLEYECTLKQKCQMLLRVVRRLFTQVASLDILLRLAADQAKQLTKAEFCSVLLIDVVKMELTESYYPKQGEKEIAQRRFPMNVGITSHVLKSGVVVNVKSVKEHQAFDPDIDSRPGIDCRSLLFFPIREQTGIIGVGQIINKIGDPYFDAMDEELALAFSVYCGLCIVHSVVYQKIQEAHIRSALANELVMYHMKVTYEMPQYKADHAADILLELNMFMGGGDQLTSSETSTRSPFYHAKVSDTEVSRVLQCNGFHDHPHSSSLHFNPRILPLRELPCYVLNMFIELGYVKKFNLKREKIVTLILYVKKGYRDVPYHSWMHAHSVAQWAFAALMNYKLVSHGYLTELQGLMYIIAALVHDLDHRGTTNSFQMNGQTTLAALYSSEGSVMERHHLAQAICILNTEGCDILEALPRRDYDRALILLRDYVLATDLANYFKNMNEYRTISYDYQKNNRVHVAALQCLLMNAADLSDQLKDWGSVKKTAVSVLTEFFKQGDEEKSRGELPAVIMDREKCVIPELEIQFITGTCIPLWEILGRIIPKAALCIKILENHIERWEASKPIFAEVPPAAGMSVLLSSELDNLIELNLKEKERLRLEAEKTAVVESQ